MQVVKESGDDRLPLPTAEDEQGLTELQVEEACMQLEDMQRTGAVKEGEDGGGNVCWCRRKDGDRDFLKPPMRAPIHALAFQHLPRSKPRFCI